MSQRRRKEDGSVVLRLWNYLPLFWRSATVLFLAAALGWTARSLLAVQMTLPHRLERMAVEVDSLRAGFIVLQEMQRRTQRQLDLLVCTLMAERRGSPWQECIQ